MCTATLPGFTAEDLMRRDIKTVDAGWPIRDAAVHLVGFNVRGVPVVDSIGRCVGVFSVSDVARWVAGQNAAWPPQPRTCSNQNLSREPGGRETVLCHLPEGVCSLQRIRESSTGHGVECNEPHCVPTDWQLVEFETGPVTVGEVMTTQVVTVSPGTSMIAMVRTILDHGVHQLFVLDDQKYPVGVVSVDDLLQVLAYPEVERPSQPRSDLLG